jgi:hypothetical protein
VGEEYAPVLREIVERFNARGYTLRFETAFLKNRFYNEKGKDSLSYVLYGDYREGREGNERLFLRLKLNQPDRYIGLIEKLPGHLKQPFINVWCGNCAEKCNRKIIYTLAGEPKTACGCFFFTFKEPTTEDLDALMELFDAEQVVRKEK